MQSKLAFMAALLLCCFVVLYSDQAYSTPTQTKNHAIDKNPSLNPSALAQENAATNLADQWINASGQFNDRLLSTVYWSLGTICALFLGLIGFNWFFNFKIYERDKESLRVELKGELAQQASVIYKEMRELFDKEVVRVEALIAAEVLSKNKNLRESLKSVNTKVQELEWYVEWKTQEIESRHWETKEVYGNVLGCQVRIGEVALKMDYDWLVTDTLNKIESVLPKINKVDFDPEFLQFLEKLPSQYSIPRRRITDLVSKI